MIALLLSVVALAHQPQFSDDAAAWSTWQSAFEVDDPDVSIVLYREVTCEVPEIWLKTEADPGYELFVQLGVPEIERLTDYRPSIAVLAPGLPAADLPFEVPAGLGAVVFDTADVSEPAAFFEPFTSTASWIVAEEVVTLPEGGPAYIVAFHPGRQTGKLWVAVGTIEDFSGVDFADAAEWGELVNDFHETGVYEPPPEVEETVCVDAPDDAVVEVESGGCATVVGGPRAGVLLALAATLARRRRRG